MMHRLSLPTACMLVVLLGMGCDLFRGAEAPDTIAGSWRGTVTTQDSTYTLMLNLEQRPDANLQRSSVAGDGRLSSARTAWDFIVRGTITKPTLSLSLRFTSARPAQLDGEVDDAVKTIEGELLGGPASFDAASVTLERQ